MKKKLDCYLRSYRRRWGLTQDELATLLGCKTGAVISRLERHGRQPSLETAYALEAIFGTASVELFPSLHAKVKKKVIALARDMYDELQGDSSKTARLKLDFFEDVFARAHPQRKKNMKARRRYNLVLAIYPSTRGFAFVVFEGPLSPVDWGVREVRGRHKNQRCLVGIAAVLERYRPDVLVLQDMSSTDTRRAYRLRELNAGIGELADERGIPVYAYSRTQVRDGFEPFGLANKHAIAEAIAKHIPAFERYLPPVRKPWMSEDARMGLFDAAALALTFFQRAAGGEQEAA